MKKFPYLFTTCALFLVLLGSCGGEKSGDKLEEDEKKSNKPVPAAISNEVISDMVQSIPSPIEISYLIKSLEIKYDKDLLNAFENSKKYNTDYQRAMNLGVYSTDLGYANIYQQTGDALFYLGAVKEMADALKIGDFFDFKTIKKLAATKDSLDKLLTVTTHNLESINEHLQEKKRADLTILILTGGWLESLYLTCEVAKKEVAKKEQNKVLKTRIGEQKIILEQLLLLLSFYKDNDNIQKLLQDFNKLNKIYENVKITYSSGESVTKPGPNGELITEGGTSSEILLTDKDLDSILISVKEIRSKIIS